MPLLQVEITDFVQAATLLHEHAGDPVSVAAGQLVEALSGCGGMAGDDPGGTDWAHVYDRAARSTLRATHQVVNAAFTTGAMFARSARNYADAETASTTSGSQRPATSAQLQTLPGTEYLGPPRLPPSAFGSDGDTPTGWWLIQHTVGYLWPNGHQDRLHRAAAAWNRSANVLDDAAFETFRAGTLFSQDQLPEAGDILTVTGGLSDHLSDLAAAHRGLADACTDLAHHIDECHSAVEHELTELVAWTAGIQTVGVVASIFTLGAAEAPTQAAQAAKIAQTAGVVGGLIAKCLTATRFIATTVAPIVLASDRLSAVLEMLATSKLAVSAASAVPAVLKTAKTSTKGVSLIKKARTEAGAFQRVEKSTVSLVKKWRLPKHIAQRTEGESGHWGNPQSRADHFRRHGKGVRARSEDDYVTKSSDFLARAHRENLPTKIDEDGVIRIYDPKRRLFASFSPDGATKTFFRPKSLTYFDRQPGKLQ